MEVSILSLIFVSKKGTMIATTHNKEFFDQIRKQSHERAIFESEMKMYDHLIESASVLKTGCKEFVDVIEEHIVNAKRIINRF